MKHSKTKKYNRNASMRVRGAAVYLFLSLRMSCRRQTEKSMFDVDYRNSSIALHGSKPV